MRPPSCPQCGAPSQPPGQPVGLVGHGVVPRTVWGPVEAGGAPERIDVLLRRYRCLHCGTVVRVGPRGLALRRRYSLGAIALALTLFGLADAALTVGDRHARARKAVSPDPIVAYDSELRWRSLERWTGSVREGCLLKGALLPVGLASLTDDKLAHRLGQALVGHADVEVGTPALEAWTAFRAAQREGWVM